MFGKHRLNNYEGNDSDLEDSDYMPQTNKHRSKQTNTVTNKQTQKQTNK